MKLSEQVTDDVNKLEISINFEKRLTRIYNSNRIRNTGYGYKYEVSYSARLQDFLLYNNCRPRSDIKAQLEHRVKHNCWPYNSR